MKPHKATGIQQTDSSVATGGQEGATAPPSLSKTVSEIRPDPLRFIFEGWGRPTPRYRSSCGWSIILLHNFFPTASVRHLIVDGMVLTA
jgi:hypothetical protein